MHIPVSRYRRFARVPIAPVVAMAGALWLCACAQNTVKVDSAWRENAPRNQTFARILVIGGSPDIDSRCAFEWALAAQLKSATVQAVASCDAMPLQDPLSREAVEHAVDSLQADSVVATHLVMLKIGAQDGGGRDSRGGGYYKATGSGYATGVYGYTVPVIYGTYETAPSLETINGEAQIATSFYEARGRTLIYTMTTSVKARDIESGASGRAILAEPIAKRLRRDGLIH